LKQNSTSASSPAHLPGRADLPLHPKALKTKADVPSPYRSENGLEAMTMTAEGGDWFLVPVTIVAGATVVPWNHPLEIDARDFPTLASRGLHSEIELNLTRTITGRSLAEITQLAQPGALSSAGFMADDETILPVLKGDNRLVAKLGLTHAQMARPLLHICNMIREDSKREGRAVRNHTILYTIFYNGRAISLDIQFTKGGQKSIFDDRLDGAWTIKIRRDLDEAETNLLNRAYAHLDKEKRDILTRKLSEMLVGEMQPFYIYRYGFYEGHTAWRADPIAIAFIFGLKSIKEIEAAFPEQLDKVLTQHFTSEN
jgi:hypothetical protein